MFILKYGKTQPLVIFPGSLALETTIISGQLCLSARAYSYLLSVIRLSLLSSWHKITPRALLLLAKASHLLRDVLISTQKNRRIIKAFL